VEIEFDGGVTATLIYDGYGYFDDRELMRDIFSPGTKSWM
jgi:hypothetical protein